MLFKHIFDITYYLMLHKSLQDDNGETHSEDNHYIVEHDAHEL